MVAHGFIRIFLPLEAIQRRTGAMKSVINTKAKEIREKIKSVASVLSVIGFERVRKSPKALEHEEKMFDFSDNDEVKEKCFCNRLIISRLQKHRY